MVNLDLTNDDWLRQPIRTEKLGHIHIEETFDGLRICKMKEVDGKEEQERCEVIAKDATPFDVCRTIVAFMTKEEAN